MSSNKKDELEVEVVKTKKSKKKTPAESKKKKKADVVEEAVVNSDVKGGASGDKKEKVSATKSSKKSSSVGSKKTKKNLSTIKKGSEDSVVFHGVGRRKCAVSRCYLTKGTGEIYVNGIDYVVFFKNNPLLYHVVLLPLKLLKSEKDYDIKVDVYGGGFSSQADAIKLSISICLSKISPENRTLLKSSGYLTTDSRIVERKKPGRKKARKRFQFSKR